jgi:hypothetical protein
MSFSHACLFPEGAASFRQWRTLARIKPAITSPQLAFMVTRIMAKSIRVTTKKKRGRPATTGRGVQVGERWHNAELAAIDAWIASHGEEMTRGEAIRRLVELGLKAKK